MNRLMLPFLAGLLFISGCSALESEVPSIENTVILISVDGMRSHYIDWFDTPNMDRLISAGAHANKGMKPVYPTKTFPNHYSIVTGLDPSNHGIVSNNMYDPEMDQLFSISDREAVESEAWWGGGEPIWTAVQRQGGKAATYFWVGSEAPFDGIRPEHWYIYDGSVPGNERVDQALTWLDLPEDDRPQFISLYFSEVDDAGHQNGPRAQETAQAVANVDGYLGRLLDGLQARNLYDRVNIILVSDHGMSQLSPDRVVSLDDYVNLDDLRYIDSNPLIGIWPVEGKTQGVFDALDGAHPNLHVWLKDTLPERFRYKGHRRIPPIVGHVDDGWSISRSSEMADAYPQRFTGGTHGYDNELESMRALFIGHGPAFKDGVTIEPFLNIELYNVMTSIMGIEPSPNDGTEGALDAILE
ncbi:MAG: ectonucleotide pyrophosphatase/phosphodiesterase [Rhodothermales bacterium]